MPDVLLGDAESAESCSSWRWTGSKTYHRSLEQETVLAAREIVRQCLCKCYLDRVEPAERRKRDEQVDDTRSPLGKRVPLWADIIFLIWSRGAWGC